MVDLHEAFIQARNEEWVKEMLALIEAKTGTSLEIKFEGGRLVFEEKKPVLDVPYEAEHC